jgi:CRP-like cAMP-binding protein
MPTTTDLLTQNRLLKSLPYEEYERLSFYAEPVHYSAGKIVYETGDCARYVYFPLNGVIGLLLITAEGESIEVGMIGNEGTTAVPVVMHPRKMPYRAVVQSSMDALRIQANAIHDVIERGGRLNHILLCYSHSLFTQIAQSAVCNRFHLAEQRFSRWLLDTRDRIGSDTIEVTQEGLASMLGIQRSVVSASETALQRAGLITFGRGVITILDRHSLEATACECYEIVRNQVCRCLTPLCPIDEF